MRRANVPGTKRAEFNQWPKLPFEDMDSSLCVQQHIQQILLTRPEDVNLLLKIPKNTDVLVWQYEHLRTIVMQLNHLLAFLVHACTVKTCPEMESDGQRFLCAAHVPPQECCALDYCCHTIEKATQFLQNTTLFPGRMDVPAKSAEQFASQIRRLFRVLLHGFHAHREIFKQFESKYFLTKRFVVFARRFQFLDDDTLGQIPIDEGEQEQEEQEENDEDNEEDGGEEEEEEGEEEEANESSSLSEE